jgi:hypothetical protein
MRKQVSATVCLQGAGAMQGRHSERIFQSKVAVQ